MSPVIDAPTKNQDVRTREREVNPAAMIRAHRASLRKVLDFTRFLLTGALAGLAVVNTYTLLTGADLSRPTETVSMGVGATAMAILIKALHIV